MMIENKQSELASVEMAQTLMQATGDLFAAHDYTLDQPLPGFIRFRGAFVGDLAQDYDRLRRRFEQYGYTPLVRRQNDEPVLIAQPGVYARRAGRWDWLVNAVMFVATIVTTLFAGALGDPRFTGREFWLGWPFSLSILLILGAHELGHYFMARRHGVHVSLPYFIPFPSLLGTMGAVILMKEPIKNKRTLFDIGAAGPLAGLVFAVPILFYGLATSAVARSGPGLLEGNSLFYALAKITVFGRFLPDGLMDVQLNQVAWAGWIGLLVTGLNLLPVGQLDGGHITYVLFDRYVRYFFWPLLVGLAALALFTGTTMWWLWIALLLLFGRNHAQPLDDVTPLDPRRRALAIITLIIFVLVFVPIPLRQIGPLP